MTISSTRHGNNRRAPGFRRRVRATVWIGCATLISLFLFPPRLPAQIDPERRDLFQFGYNAPFEGHPPLSIYAYYYRNQPDFLRTNLTLRLAIAPTYLDSELGLRGWPGTNTDIGFGLAGGGFADSYYEIRDGQYRPGESFDGYGGGTSISVYHLFDPGRKIPLYGIVRATARYATYDRASQTANGFQVPDATGIFSERAGLRWGGREPTLFPSLAMELSIWQQTEFRSNPGAYGFHDRNIEARSYLFWAEAYLAYTMPEWKHNFSINFTAGTSIDADRLSAYRLGGFLPMVSEFPLSIPGYYYQELSARQFFLASGSYTIPLDRRNHWSITTTAATAVMDYLPGMEEAGHWRSGVGAGLFYATPTWRVMVGYGYGIDAVRSHGRGANSIGVLVQFDLAPAKEAFFKPEPPGMWRGFQRLIGVLGS